MRRIPWYLGATIGLVLTTLVLLNLGCDLTLGPKVKTVYVLIHPGKPAEVMLPAKVRVRVLDGSGDPVEQDIGGWIVMPPDHWETVKKALEAKKTSEVK